MASSSLNETSGQLSWPSELSRGQPTSWLLITAARPTSWRSNKGHSGLPARLALGRLHFNLDYPIPLAGARASLNRLHCRMKGKKIQFYSASAGEVIIKVPFLHQQPIFSTINSQARSQPTGHQGCRRTPSQGHQLPAALEPESQLLSGVEILIAYARAPCSRPLPEIRPLQVMVGRSCLFSPMTGPLGGAGLIACLPTGSSTAPARLTPVDHDYEILRPDDYLL